MTTRRTFTFGLTASAAMAVLPAQARDGGFGKKLAADFARIERESGGRLGVAVLNTANGASAGHRAGERFAMCSVFKMLAAAAVLARVDAGKEKLDRVVAYKKDDLITYSPETEKHVATGMTMAAICDAAVTLSDNTAGNLMLASMGGPAGLTRYLRKLGDGVTRLDRIEPDLNEATPGDARDTTTPLAMRNTMRTLLTGNALSAKSRQQLTDWLLGNKVGDTRLRAGLPAGWTCGDKPARAGAAQTTIAGLSGRRKSRR